MGSLACPEEDGAGDRKEQSNFARYKLGPTPVAPSPTHANTLTLCLIYHQSFQKLPSIDLVKHSLRVLIQQLKPQDRFCLIAFGSLASIVVEAQNMDTPNRKRVLDSIERIDPDGNTNLWGALELALERVVAWQVSHTSLVLLTDGEPTRSTEPPAGSAIAFAARCAALPLSISLHAIGYGYDINSTFLAFLAEEGSGQFSFIPDGSMVGHLFSLSLYLLSVSRCLSLSRPAPPFALKIDPYSLCVLGTVHAR